MTDPSTDSRSNETGWRVAILGATGMVGRVMVEKLAESSIPVAELRLLSTPRSAGTRVSFRGEDTIVEAVSEGSFEGIDLALFSAGASASEEWAARAVRAGAFVVDNSSRYRMEDDVSLVVPEVNAESIPSAPAIIANPNCATIQMVVALAPIHRAIGLKRIHVATYQAASGSGHRAVAQLEGEMESSTEAPRFYPHPLRGNVIPQCDVFLEDGYTREEQKMIDETRKILSAPEIWIHPTCVRVPVATGHSEAVYFETSRPAKLADIQKLLQSAPGVSWKENLAEACYPTPLEAEGTDPVWVGRLRKDRDDPNGFHLWVVSDNLRKGAATNALQIAEELWVRRKTRS